MGEHQEIEDFVNAHYHDEEGDGAWDHDCGGGVVKLGYVPSSLFRNLLPIPYEYVEKGGWDWLGRSFRAERLLIIHPTGEKVIASAHDKFQAPPGHEYYPSVTAVMVDGEWYTKGWAKGVCYTNMMYEADLKFDMNKIEPLVKELYEAGMRTTEARREEHMAAAQLFLGVTLDDWKRGKANEERPIRVAEEGDDGEPETPDDAVDFDWGEDDYDYDPFGEDYSDAGDDDGQEDLDDWDK